MRTPVVRFGGKSRLAPWLVSLLQTEFAPHVTYVEPFCGGAALLYAKSPSAVEILNDIDDGVVDFFCVLRDRALFERLHHALTFTLWSRSELEMCARTWKDVDDLVERVRRWFVVVRQSFTHEVCPDADWLCSKKENEAERFSALVDDLLRYARRLRKVQIERGSFERVMRLYDDEETLFYCDPTYVAATRVDGFYDHEMTDEQHIALLEFVCACKGQVLLSGYASPLYERYLTGPEWLRCEKTRAMTIRNTVSTRKLSVRTEVAWVKSHRKNLFSLSADTQRALLGDAL